VELVLGKVNTEGEFVTIVGELKNNSAEWVENFIMVNTFAKMIN
jgi:hypothetical protein